MVYIYYIYIIYIYIYIMKRKYKQNLLESFYIFTNSFTISLASDSQTIRNIIKDTLRTASSK